MIDKTKKTEDSHHTNLPEHSKEDKPSLLESVAETVGYAVGTAVGVGAAAGSTAVEAGKAVAETAVEMGEAAAKQTHNLIEQATHTAGEIANYLSENWLIRKLAGVLNLNWLLGSADNINFEKAEAEVKKLQQEHPNESPSQIAHRIMLDKATKAGGIGLGN